MTIEVCPSSKHDGPHMGPTWASRRGPRGQPTWAPHVKCNRVSTWAPDGLPQLGPRWAPSGLAHLGFHLFLYRLHYYLFSILFQSTPFTCCQVRGKCTRYFYTSQLPEHQELFVGKRILQTRLPDISNLTRFHS